MHIAKLLILVLVAGAAHLAGPSPARADVLTCGEVWSQVAHLVEAENGEGMTAERLDRLGHLVDVMGACTRQLGYQVDGDVGRWATTVAAYFQPEDVARALCLIDHESGGDPLARNPASGASGLLQVMPFWAGRFGLSTSDLFEPAVNLEVAAWILGSQGWTAWSPYRRGLCGWPT